MRTFFINLFKTLDKRRKLLLFFGVLMLTHIILPPITSMVSHPLSRQSVYEMMQTEEVLVSSSNRDMLVYVSQTDERAFVFDWDEGLRIHIFVRSALINRYRLLTHFSFQDGLMPWSVSIDADSFRYNIDAGDARYIRYADITLTQAGRSRVFYATWVYAVVVLLSAAVTPGLTRGPLKIAERVSRV